MRVISKYLFPAVALLLLAGSCMAAPAVQGQQTVTFSGSQKNFAIPDALPIGTLLGIPFKVSVNGKTSYHPSNAFGKALLTDSIKKTKIVINGADRWVYATNTAGVGFVLTTGPYDKDQYLDVGTDGSPTQTTLGGISSDDGSYSFPMILFFVKTGNITPETKVPTEMSLPQLQLILNHRNEKGEYVNDGVVETLNLQYKNPTPFTLQRSETLYLEGNAITGDPAIEKAANDNTMPVGATLGKPITSIVTAYFSGSPPQWGRGKYQDDVTVVMDSNKCPEMKDEMKHTIHVCSIPNVEGIGYEMYAETLSRGEDTGKEDYEKKRLPLQVTLQFHKTGYINPGTKISSITNMGKLLIKVDATNTDIKNGYFDTDKPISFTPTNDSDINVKGLGCD